MDRYDRQVKFPPFGQQGQQKLQKLHAIIIGVGALGSGIAEQLVRSGIKKLTIVDKDIVSLTNLHRQSGYTEADVEEMMPKVFALKKRLVAMNHEVEIDPLNEEITARNIIGILEEVKPDIVLDGLDQFETRYLINEATRQLNIPYIYGAVIGSQVSVFPIDQDGPCLHCVMPDVPETMESCDVYGVLPPAVHLASSFVVSELFYYLMHDTFSYTMVTTDIFKGTMRRTSIQSLKEEDCAVCGQHIYQRLAQTKLDEMRLLCGGVYQIRLKADYFEAPLQEEVSTLIQNPFIKRLRYKDYDMTLYQDGRLLIYNVDNSEYAKEMIPYIFKSVHQ